MRILSPKIAFRNNLIHDVSGLIKYRNKLELYEKFKSDDLKIWASNHLDVEAVDTGKDDYSTEGYYQFISMLDNSLSVASEKESFQQLLNMLMDGKHDGFESVLSNIEKIIVDYELFFDELPDFEKSALMNKNLDVFLGFSITIDKCSEEISEQFIENIHVLLADGYQEEDNEVDLETHRADDFTHITEIKTKFIITRCRGPLTLENLIPAYESKERSENAKSFVDIYNKASEQQVINRIYAPGTKIVLKDSSAFAEYIEVKYDE